MSPHVDGRHVAVVGAGFAGLAAAGALAARGHAVTLFEADADAGGKARRIEAAGALVDVGPTLLTDAGRSKPWPPSRRPTSRSPRDSDASTPGSSRRSPHARRLTLWADSARLEASVASLGPDAIEDWRRVLDLAPAPRG